MEDEDLVKLGALQQIKTNYEVSTDVISSSRQDCVEGCMEEEAEDKFIQQTVSKCDVESKVSPVATAKLVDNQAAFEKVDDSRTVRETLSQGEVDKKGNGLVKLSEIHQSLARGLRVTNIHSLPNEVLDLIFSYLNIRQRMRLEVVCKRWRHVGKDMTWNKPKRLVFDPDNRRENPFRGKCDLCDANLESILSRCGPSLKEVTLKKFDRPKCDPSYRVVVTERSLEIIAKYCRNLETLKLKNLKLNPLRLKRLAKGCSKLKIVDFSKFGISDEGFSIFYQICQSLESLTLYPDRKKLLNCPLYNFVMQGEGFEYFNPNLSVLNLRSCGSLDITAIENLTSRCMAIRDLQLSIVDAHKWDSDVIFEMLRHFKTTLKLLALNLPLKSFNWCEALSLLDNLEELHLLLSGIVLGCPCYQTKNCFRKLSPNLKCLQISHQFSIGNFNDQFILTKLFMNCDTFEKLTLVQRNLLPETLRLMFKYRDTLKELDLSGFRSDNYIWCEFFGEFPNLETLKLIMCKEVDDNLARVLSKTCTYLKILHVASSSVTDEGLLHLSSLPNLTVLDISDCGGITDEGLEILAAHGKIEELYIATSSKNDSLDISDKGCSSLASFCPCFRLLDVSNMNGSSKITDNLVTAFREAVTGGFLKPVVELLVGGTAVSDCSETCEGLEVYFSFYEFCNDRYMRGTSFGKCLFEGA